jgi:acetyltransferase
MVSIEGLTAEQTKLFINDLIELLQDGVNSGASIGFLPPLSEEEAQTYWQKVIQDLEQQKRMLMVATIDNHVVGTVQLALETRPNGLHRAEIQKMIVHTEHRKHGIGKALMTALDAAARGEGRTLLILDTRKGDDAENLYRQLGYIRAGTIPRYVRNANEGWDDTVFYYKFLQ